MNPEDDTPENREIVATVEARLPRDSSQDVSLDEAIRKFDGMDVRQSEAPADRKRHMGHHH